MLSNILAQVRGEANLAHFSEEDADDGQLQKDAVHQLLLLIEDKTATIRAMNIDRHGVVS